MDTDDARTIISGLFPSGQDVKSLPPEGRKEIRDAVDVILRLHDYNAARLELALEQLDRAADEIDRLRATQVWQHAYIDFVRWVESWIANPVNSYSVAALDGLFGMTRDKIAALSPPATQGK